MSHLKKQEIRERILVLLKNQDEKERLAKSRQIERRLYQLSCYDQAQTIMFYCAFQGEVETREMIKKTLQNQKNVLLPKINHNHTGMIPVQIQNVDSDLSKGKFGILEPKDNSAFDLKAIEVCIVPGIAFDRHNNRLGRGGAYYDRFLCELSKNTQTVGLAFDFQLLDQLPYLETHDQSVSHVITNE